MNYLGISKSYSNMTGKYRFETCIVIEDSMPVLQSFILPILYAPQKRLNFVILFILFSLKSFFRGNSTQVARMRSLRRYLTWALQLSHTNTCLFEIYKEKTLH